MKTIVYDVSFSHFIRIRYRKPNHLRHDVSIFHEYQLDAAKKKVRDILESGDQIMTLDFSTDAYITSRSMESLFIAKEFGLEPFVPELFEQISSEDLQRSIDRANQEIDEHMAKAGATRS